MQIRSNTEVWSKK